MKNFEETISELMAQAAGGEPWEYAELIGVPPKSDMGDYAVPCFPLAKKLKNDPKRIAKDLAGKISLEFTPFSSVEAAGPYLNFRLDNARMAEEVLTSVMEEGKDFGASDMGDGKRVIVDYSSPNIAKPFHIGHLRSTVIGAALYRIYEAAGYEPVGINHLGDWGTQFGMVMSAFDDHGDESELATRPIAYSLDLYVEYNKKCEKDPEARELAKQWFKRLEADDGEAVSMWRMFRDYSLSKFENIYERLGIEFDHYTGESFYNKMMGAALEKARASGALEHSSDGAELIRLDDDGMPPFILVKSDGATLYATREIAAALYREEEYGPDLMLYVVGTPQELHFRQFKKSLEKMGLSDLAEKVVHVKFGHVHGMSTRRGEVVLLEDVLDEARQKAAEKIEENVEAGKLDAEVDRKALADAVGIGAIIANDLKHRRERDITFEWEQAMQFDGETGPYLQYAYARIKGIMRKSGRDISADVDFSELSEPETRTVVRYIADYPRAIEKAVRENEPSLVTTYLFDLTKAWNLFYTHHRVIGSGPEKEPARLLLAECTGVVIRNALSLIGIPVLEKM